MLSIKKRILFSVFFLCIVLLGIEFTSVVLHSILKKELFSFSKIHADQQRIAKAEIVSTNSSPAPIEVIHPYLGFILNPASNHKARTDYHGGLSASSFGFLDDKWPIQKREPDKVILAITGGSVAGWFGIQGVNTLIDDLKKSPMFKDKKFQVIRLALGGYKQPQQLLTMSYLLSLGAEFDVLLNIDGFNEVALPIAENLPKHVFPSFPRNWYYRASALPDTGYQAQIGKLVMMKELRQELAKILSRGPWGYSPTILLSWRIGNHYLNSMIDDMQRAILDYEAISNGSADFQARGPGWNPNDDAKIYGELADIWGKSSGTLAKLAKAHGIAYFHFLQPNQFLKGSKPIGPEEAKIALSDSPYQTGVVKGYPELIKRGNDLSKSGIQFHDLTSIFKNHKESLYIDNCCHVSPKANEILGAHIATLMLQSLSR